MPDTPELDEASRVLERIVLGRYVERLERWFERRSDETPEWGEASALGDTLLYLDVDELAALRDALRALAEPYLERLTRAGAAAAWLATRDVPPGRDPGRRAVIVDARAAARRTRLSVPRLLRENGVFRRYWGAHTVSLFGDQITLLAIPLIAVLTLDASAAQMGYLTAVALAPVLLFALHAGAWVDSRGQRRRAMIACDLGRAACSCQRAGRVRSSTRSRSRSSTPSPSELARSRCCSTSRTRRSSRRSSRGSASSTRALC